jgi:peroxiredoxin
MIELGELEAHHAEFDKRNARVIVVSLEVEKNAQATQSDFPHLVVVADKERGLAKALQVVHRQSAPDGGDTTAPTTLLVDGAGTVRWTFRPDTFFRRLSPAEIVEAFDKRLGDAS